MAKLISKIYAQALFELAVEENKTLLFLEEITGLLDVIHTNTEFKQFMNHPKIPKEDKIKVVENVFTGRIDKELTGLLVTIIEKDRYTEIESILFELIASIKEYNHIGTANVTTAVTLIRKKRILRTDCLPLRNIKRLSASMMWIRT